MTESNVSFSKEFIKSFNEQDSRGTRMPYLYAIMDVERVCGISSDYEYDAEVWMDGDSNEFHSLEALCEFLVEEDLVDQEDVNAISDLEDVLESFENYTRVRYKNVRMVKNVFLTEEKARAYLKKFHFHYDDPEIFVMHLFENDEFVNVINVLSAVAGQGEVDE